MLEYTVTEEYGGTRGVAANGRIDALTAPELQRLFDELVQSGERRFVADMNKVAYVSSAGLRVFLSLQKQLKKIGGEIIFLGMQRQVQEVFNISGLKAIFRTVAVREELPALLDEFTGAVVSKADINGLRIEYLEGVNEKGNFYTVGSTGKLADCSYMEEDVVSVNAWDMPFGCGFATVGESYEEYKGLFGESMVIDGNFFYYPAMKHSSVDFLFNTRANTATEYRFLHGFGFNGPYRYVLSFEAKEKGITLSSLMDAFLAFCQTSVLGVILIAKSKGIWGMHLKKAPLSGHRPGDGRSIFEPGNFSEWVDFPVEPTCTNEVVVAVGIGATSKGSATGGAPSVVAEGSNCHLHAGLFGKSPMNENVGDFDEELLRIFNELNASKIVHLLGKSRFSGGLAALIDLEG